MSLSTKIKGYFCICIEEARLRIVLLDMKKQFGRGRRKEESSIYSSASNR